MDPGVISKLTMWIPFSRTPLCVPTVTFLKKVHYDYRAIKKANLPTYYYYYKSFQTRMDAFINPFALLLNAKTANLLEDLKQILLFLNDLKKE